ncbi:MAG: hypothetical protein QMD11_05510 [Smithella sp.]|nr:hypothetical protein [Smithella sp.]
MTTFPELRALMAKHGMNLDKMAQVIDTTYVTFSKKLNGNSDFTYSDMLKIKDFFVAKGEKVTVEHIFFAWGFTIVNKKKAAGCESCG